MQLTSKEQALLTVALDDYLRGAEGYSPETDQMWADLYDAVICADIDDVGEEYDPFDEDYEADEAEFEAWLAAEMAAMEAAEEQLDLEDVIKQQQVTQVGLTTHNEKDRFNRFGQKKVS